MKALYCVMGVLFLSPTFGMNHVLEKSGNEQKNKTVEISDQGPEEYEVDTHVQRFSKDGQDLGTSYRYWLQVPWGED